MKMRLAQESEREHELKQTVANLSKEIQQLRDRLSAKNATKRVYKETAAAKLALKLGEMENEIQDEHAQPRTTIPHMRRRLKQNDISKKQNVIEAKSVRRNDKKLPLSGTSDPTRPELNLGPTIAVHMPDLEKAVLEAIDNGSVLQDGINIPEGEDKAFNSPFLNIMFLIHMFDVRCLFSNSLFLSSDACLEKILDCFRIIIYIKY